MAYIQNNNPFTTTSPFKQDVKFDTTVHDYGKRAAKMTDKERSDYREGAKIALSFTPVPVVGPVAKVISKIPGVGGLVKKGLSKIKSFFKKPKVVKPKITNFGASSNMTNFGKGGGQAKNLGDWVKTRQYDLKMFDKASIKKLTTPIPKPKPTSSSTPEFGPWSSKRGMRNAQGQRL